MIDNFSLALTHALMLYAAWKLLSRPDLDDEDTGKASGDASGDAPAKPIWGRNKRGWGRK